MSTALAPPPKKQKLEANQSAPIHHVASSSSNSGHTTLPSSSLAEPSVPSVAAAPHVRTLRSSLTKPSVSSVGAAPHVAVAHAPPVRTLLYIPGAELPKLRPFINQQIELRIPARHLTVRNREVYDNSIWGTNVYTDDSDAVAILRHTNNIYLRMEPPIFPGVAAVFDVLPAKATGYASSTQYDYKSQCWAGPYTKCSLRLSRVTPIVCSFRVCLSRRYDLVERRDPTLLDPEACRGLDTLTPPDEPKKQYSQRRSRPVKMVHFMYDSQLDPCMKYDVQYLFDSTVDARQWLSASLVKETLYLEGGHPPNRYELSLRSYDERPYYRWAKVKPKIFAPYVAPLPEGDPSLTILDRNLAWSDFLWGDSSVTVRGKKYHIEKMSFRPNDDIGVLDDGRRDVDLGANGGGAPHRSPYASDDDAVGKSNDMKDDDEDDDGGEADQPSSNGDGDEEDEDDVLAVKNGSSCFVSACSGYIQSGEADQSSSNGDGDDEDEDDVLAAKNGTGSRAMTRSTRASRARTRTSSRTRTRTRTPVPSRPRRRAAPAQGGRRSTSSDRGGGQADNLSNGKKRPRRGGRNAGDASSDEN